MQLVMTSLDPSRSLASRLSAAMPLTDDELRELATVASRFIRTDRAARPV